MIWKNWHSGQKKRQSGFISVSYTHLDVYKRQKWVDRLARPLFDLIRPVPGLAWIPMFILLFGIGILPKAAVIFLSTSVACIVNSYTGIKQTKQEHLWVGDVFGFSNLQKLFKIAIPTALPMIFTGLRVAMGAAWMALVAAELLASSVGLGYMIQQGRYASKPALVDVYKRQVLQAGVCRTG